MCDCEANFFKILKLSTIVKFIPSFLMLLASAKYIVPREKKLNINFLEYLPGEYRQSISVGDI